MYGDGVVEIVVMCDICKFENTHTITKSYTKSKSNGTIDLTNMASRRCHNVNNCDANYKLN